ncbi:MAG: shikimate dehydrogenase, partial [Actinobacteria bacterium]|nr:shikimate dehydrogenase [Actinomycetota bacterium]
MIRAGVLGSPISHSLSPLIHTLAFDLLAIEGDYRAFEVVPADLEDFLSAHIEMTGFS